MTWLLLKLLPKALRYADGKERKFVFHAALAWVCDVIVARTTLAEIAGRPAKGEVTVSHMLERLAHPFNSLDPNHALYWEISLYINRQSPTKDHIKAVL